MLRHITFTVFITTSMNTLATGMVPETSVLLVDEKRGEASINIKNTDDHPSLLYTTIVDLPESNKSIRLIPTQPVIRVEAGQVQQVRFLLQATVPLQSEELKRVTFEVCGHPGGAGAVFLAGRKLYALPGCHSVLISIFFSKQVLKLPPH